MNALTDMIKRYKPESASDYDNVLKQIIQEITLLGLWRGKFFEKAAFYGGSALRIFYGLDRFSEDLDFSLLQPDKNFNLALYFPSVINELKSFGFEVEISSREKDKGGIETAFIKANTLIHFVKIGVPAEISGKIAGNRLLKVKFEVDRDPPSGFETETKFSLEPIPFSVMLYKPSSLFAGKMHAVLCRSWGSRIKGRDWYDLYWFVKNSIPLNLDHLSKRMQQSGHLDNGMNLDIGSFSRMLTEKISVIDFKNARDDVIHFLKDSSSVELWSDLFFMDIAKKIIYSDRTHSE